MVCPPRKLFRPMAKRSKKILLRVFSSSSSWRSQTILLSARTFFTIIVLSFLIIHFIIVSLDLLTSIGKPMDISSSLLQRQSMFLSTEFIFTQTQPIHSVNGQFTRRLNVSMAKGQVKNGFPTEASLLQHLEHHPTSSFSSSRATLPFSRLATVQFRTW